MKKVFLILIIIVCFLLLVIGVDYQNSIVIDNNIEKAKFDYNENNVLTRDCCEYAMDQIIDDNSIVVLGSSELSSFDDVAYPPALFNNRYSDFNMIMMGTGHLQSLPNAVNIGALQNNIKNGKVVLILSPQWFTQAGLTTDCYSSIFQEPNFIEFIKNNSISKETKITIANRMNELLADDPITLKRVIKDEQIYMYHTFNPIMNIEMPVYNAFRNSKLKYETARELNGRTYEERNTNITNIDSIDWAQLMIEAENKGKEECIRNDFGIRDEYYDYFIRNNLAKLKDSSVSGNYTDSPEFGDLRQFLDVCSETGIEPLIVSIPCNGRWYDFTGFPKADRNTYYQMIRDICAEYDVAIADFSNREYELYFLRDIMHIGLKGWVYFDKAVIDFYNDRKIKDTSEYQLIQPKKIIRSSNVKTVSAGRDKFTTDINDDGINSISVSLPYHNNVIDCTSSQEHRSSTYLHVDETGEYNIRIKPDTTITDEYIDYYYILEEGAVYTINYNVDDLNYDSATISDFTLSKITF